MKNQPEHRIEVALPADVYKHLQHFKTISLIDSDSAALARIAKMLLCGIIPLPKRDQQD